MSSLQPTPAGYRIQFRLEKKTRQISLPGAKLRAAEIVQRHLDELIASKRHKTQPQELTQQWAEKTDEDLRQQLESFGLLAVQSSGKTTIMSLYDQFVEYRDHLKPKTISRYQVTGRKAELFFKSRPISSLCRADAHDFRRLMLNLGLSENTIRKSCGQLSAFVKWMQDRDVWTKSNPFDGVPKSVGSAKDAKPMIPAATIYKVIEEARGAEWPALIAMARWGGIRIPSEALGLRWEHVSWEPGRIFIESPKTSGQGKPSRLIPMFPELVPFLLTLRESQPAEETLLFPTIARQRSTIWQTFRGMIIRAGHEPWAHLWNSLRSTRETELAAEHKMHVVCDWIGNSRLVAQKHYLKTTDADFDLATKIAEKAPKDIARQKKTQRDTRQQKNQSERGKNASKPRKPTPANV